MTRTIRARLANVLFAALLPTAIGCADYRENHPRWQRLMRNGASFVPGDYEAVFFDDVTDEQFLRSVPDLRRERPKELIVYDARLTDASIDGILQLRQLERLALKRTDITIDGLLRLEGLPRLRHVYLMTREYTEDEVARLRQALPHVEIVKTPP